MIQYKTIDKIRKYDRIMVIYSEKRRCAREQTVLANPRRLCLRESLFHFLFKIEITHKKHSIDNVGYRFIFLSPWRKAASIKTIQELDRKYKRGEGKHERHQKASVGKEHVSRGAGDEAQSVSTGNHQMGNGGGQSPCGQTASPGAGA